MEEESLLFSRKSAFFLRDSVVVKRGGVRSRRNLDDSLDGCDNVPMKLALSHPCQLIPNPPCLFRLALASALVYLFV